MPGTRYPIIAEILEREYNGGKTLEIGAGAACYRDIFPSYTGTDVPGSAYIDRDSIDVFCDARELPFASESFSLVFAVSTLHLIPQPQKAMTEIARCLKINGILLVFDLPRRIKLRNLKHSRSRGEVTHFNLWTPREFYAMACASGFGGVARINNDTTERLLTKVWPDYVRPDASWQVFKAEK